MPGNDECARGEKRNRKMTETGRAYQLETKQKLYTRCERDLMKTGSDILENIEEMEEVLQDDPVRNKYVSWKRTYVTFVQTESDLRALLSEEEEEVHTLGHRQALQEINEMKSKMEKKLEQGEAPSKSGPLHSASSKSGRSIRSKIGLLRLEETQMKAELEAKEAAMKQRVVLERQQQELKWKMQELQVEEERTILEAKKAALLRFEEEEDCHDHASSQSRSGSGSEALLGAVGGADPNPCPTSSVNAQERPAAAGANVSSHMDVLSTLASILTDNNNRNRLPVLEPEVFTGNIEKFPIWMKGFETYVEHRTSCPVERLHFLGKYTGSDAHSAIAGFLHLRSAEAYAKAKEKLTSRYGNDYLVASSYSKRLREWPTIKGGDNNGLQKLADFLEHCLMASSAITGLKALNDPLTVQTTLKKLPHYISDRWKRIVDASVFGPSPCYPTFAAFVEFMSKEARIACGPANVLLETETEVKGVRPRGKAHAFSSSVEVCNTCGHKGREDHRKPRTGVKQCAKCNGEHAISSCDQFKRMTLADRQKMVEEKRLCRGCLRAGHLWRDCRRRERCSLCQRSHPTLLHDDAFQNRSRNEDEGGNQSHFRKQSSGANETAVKATSMRSSLGTKQVCDADHCHTMILPVKVFHEDRPEHAVITYALLDAQSDASFVTNSVCEALKAGGSQVELELSTMTGTTSFPSQAVKGLVIESLEDGATADLPVVYTRQVIPADRSVIPRRETCEKWPHLRQIADALHDEFKDAEIGLLLGVNCARAIKPRKIIPGEDDDPWGVKTMLGWGVVGLVGESSSNACFLVSTSDKKRQCHFSYRTRVKEVDIKQLHDVFDSDVFTTSAGKPMSQDDIKFVKTMEQEMHQLQDGHYEAPLPLKTETEKLPNNRTLAERRLQWLKKKLIKNETLCRDYKAFMQELLEKGYAERVPKEEISTENGHINYVPHHGVYHPKKGKLRVVFDCSATFQNDCLNNHLLQGPDENNSLVGILIRMREGAVAFSGDIEGMFNQVRVNPECRNLLRFLWWDGGDIEAVPTEFRMCTHLFGATSSPAVALHALRKTADEHGGDDATEATNFVKSNFYIDDGICSTTSTASALSLIQDAVELCAKGGFKLHKFVSNDVEVLKKLPLYSLSHGVREAMSLGLPLPRERVLGIQWDINRDTLHIDLKLPDKPATRRGILSSLGSLYDPLGFLSPCTLVAKNLLKMLCTERFGWDDHVPDQVLQEWLRWKNESSQLSEVSIPRCYVTEGHGQVLSYELHHFSDASYDGCGQCSYLRAIYEDGHITTALVMSKTRVTPQKVVTIPRLELVAALMSVRASCFLQRELTIRGCRHFFWTDSSAVLGYIKNNTKRFHVFVANRVQEIRQHSRPDQWFHVESGNNPADLASRGTKASELLHSRLWWHGPTFLTSQEALPASEGQFGIPDEDPEVKRSTFLTVAHQSEDSKGKQQEVDSPGGTDDESASAVTTKEQVHKVTKGQKDDAEDDEATKKTSLTERVTYFSNWHRARKSVALCLRYKHILSRKIHASQSETVSDRREDATPYRGITVEELRRGEREIIKAAQQEAFKDEYAILNAAEGSKKQLKSKSLLFRLDPFIDEEGIIRVGGRIRRSTMPQDVIHPVVLPRHGHVTELVIRHFHEKAAHSGRGITLNEIRASGYWVIGGRSAVSSAILKCVRCKRLRGKPQEQKMADLPRERMEAVEPFTNSAVDCFGPFYIKERRSDVKRWGILFTCLASRAIHLESVNSLSADSFLNACRRFVCRRGPVKQLFCDNGTNFIGGKNMLEEALKEEDHVQIRGELLKTDCDWFQFRFNVPHASSMGGVWERMIGCARSVLTSLISTHGHTMDDELFRTLLTEAEAIVNSRPLSYSAGASDDTIVPLSPNQILTLKSRVAVPYPGSFSSVDLYTRQRWRRVQFLANQFWTRWRREFLPTLQERRRWCRLQPNLKPGDIVAVIDDAEPRARWPLGRVIEVQPSADGLVRKVCVQVGSSRFSRPVGRLILLMRTRERFPVGEP